MDSSTRPTAATGHRIAVAPTDRHIVVTLDGTLLADSRAARALDETGLPTRYYVPPQDVRLDLLEHSDTVTRCPFKGQAGYYSARIDGRVVPDVAWVYDGEMRPDAEGVRGHLSFYPDRVQVTVDGQPLER